MVTCRRAESIVSIVTVMFSVTPGTLLTCAPATADDAARTAAATIRASLSSGMLVQRDACANQGAQPVDRVIEEDVALQMGPNPPIPDFTQHAPPRYYGNRD